MLCLSAENTESPTPIRRRMVSGIFSNPLDHRLVSRRLTGLEPDYQGILVHEQWFGGEP